MSRHCGCPLVAGTRSDPSLEGGRLDTGSAEDDTTTREVPHGISLWGPRFDEGPLLGLGLALEAELGVAGRRPDLAPPD